MHWRTTGNETAPVDGALQAGRQGWPSKGQDLVHVEKVHVEKAGWMLERRQRRIRRKDGTAMMTACDMECGEAAATGDGDDCMAMCGRCIDAEAVAWTVEANRAWAEAGRGALTATATEAARRRRSRRRRHQLRGLRARRRGAHGRGLRKMLTQNSASRFTEEAAPTTYWLELEYILTVSLNVPQDMETHVPRVHTARSAETS